VVEKHPLRNDVASSQRYAVRLGAELGAAFDRKYVENRWVVVVLIGRFIALGSSVAAG
jgi:hypothetical protein